MTKGNSPMMRVMLLNQHMTIETSHFGNGKYANAAKGTAGNGKDFALRNISG